MMEKSAKLTIYPMYAQVRISDKDEREIPEWTEENKFIAVGRTAHLVGTQEDLEGDVDVEVGTCPPKDCTHLLFDGQISCPSGVMCVGDIFFEDAIEVGVRFDRPISLKIYADKSCRPSKVVFLLESGDLRHDRN